MNCPYCHSINHITRRGFYTRKSDGVRIQRFQCGPCQKGYSRQTSRIDFRHRKRHLNQPIFKLLCSGLSQRRVAFALGVKPDTVAHRVVRFGKIARLNLKHYRLSRPKTQAILIDEMESFEHTKLKPLTIPIVVEEKTRKILGLGVGRIAAKGHLAVISRKKYGCRPCERKQILTSTLQDVVACTDETLTIRSDQSHNYPPLIKQIFPRSIHKTYKGRRGCVVGQGELKTGGRDPLFYLNHTYAMIRDNIKRLSRRTWCTSKRPDRLEDLLHLYAWFHNMLVDGRKAREIWLTVSST